MLVGVITIKLDHSNWPTDYLLVHQDTQDLGTDAGAGNARGQIACRFSLAKAGSRINRAARVRARIISVSLFLCFGPPNPHCSYSSFEKGPC